MKGHRRLWALFLVFGLSGALVSDRLGAFSPREQESIQARLQRLEDREEILQLLRDYGRHLDNRDFASFSQLFAEKDGEWIGGMGRAKSSQGIRKLMEDTIGRDTTGKGGGGPNYHLFLNEIINVDGNEARATTKWMFIVQNSSRQPQPFYLGHYDDTLVKEKGRWKFLKRIVYGDIPPDDPLSRK